MSPIRKAQVAGTFYPESPIELQNKVEQMLSQQNPLGIKNICGLVVPHAGYIYSGQIAAKAYKQIDSAVYDNVFIISPSHFDYFDGCSIFNGNYESPLGLIKVNSEIIEKIAGFEGMQISHLGHQNEHSLEIQLPFLQQLIPGFSLVPIVMGSQNYETADKLARAIQAVLQSPEYSNQKNLIISSSDLSHFHDLKQAHILDKVILDDIKEFDPERLNRNILEKKTEACGFGPILAGMMACKLLGATQTKILSYGTSADVNNDESQVVGYLSALFYKN